MDRKTVDHFIENEEKVIESLDDEKKDMFDYTWYFDRNFIKENAVKLYKKSPELVDKDGRSPFFYALNYNDVDTVEKLINSFPELIHRKDDKEYGILDYYLTNPSLLSAEILSQIYMINPGLTTRRQKMTTFLCACYHGDTKAVDELIKINDKVIQDTNEDGYNGSSVAKISGQIELDTYLKQKYGLTGEKPKKVIDTRSDPIKVVLLGAGDVGKTTVYKQIRNYYGDGWNSTEKRSLLYRIHQQIIGDFKYAIYEMEEDEKDEEKHGDDKLSAKAENASERIQKTKDDTPVITLQHNQITHFLLSFLFFCHVLLHR